MFPFVPVETLANLRGHIGEVERLVAHGQVPEPQAAKDVDTSLAQVQIKSTKIRYFYNMNYCRKNVRTQFSQGLYHLILLTFPTLV